MTDNKSKNKALNKLKEQRLKEHQKKVDEAVKEFAAASEVFDSAQEKLEAILQQGDELEAKLDSLYG